VWNELNRGGYLAGDVAEVLAYDRALSADELAQVKAYFHDRYGRSVIRPIAMPPPGVYDGEVAVTLSSPPRGAVRKGKSGKRVRKRVGPKKGQAT
jgi:hypothetical protein